MSKTTFIYALCEPGTRKVRYIGKSKHPRQRLTEHLLESATHKTHLGNWLRSLGRKKPNLVVLSEVDAIIGNAEEIRYIAAARGSLGMALVNGTDGGDGLTNPSPETREKLRRAITPERAAFLGNLNRGRKLSRAERTRISEKNLGRKLTPEQRKAGAEARRGLKRPGSSSRFIGVFKNAGLKNWVAEMRVGGKKLHLGCFPVEADAARARDAATLKFFGASSKFNFPVSFRE